MTPPEPQQHARLAACIFACVILIAAALLLTWWLDIIPTRQREAELLVAEFRDRSRPPRLIDRWLIKWGLMKMKQPRASTQISDDLARLGSAAVPALIQTCKVHDVGLEYFAAGALDKIGPAALPALVPALKDGDVRVRFYAAWALGRIGPPAKDAVAALIQALKDDKEIVPGMVTWALYRIGPPAVLGLIQALKDKDSVVRCPAAKALGTIGPDAKGAVPALTELLKDESKDVRDAARTAIDRIQAPGATFNGPSRGS